MMEDLADLTPIDNEKFKNWMPDEIDGFKRTSYNFQTSMGAHGNLEFRNESEEKNFSISIFDGAGDTGGAILAYQGVWMTMGMNYESESDDKYEKVKERKGQKYLESYNKRDNDSEIQGLFNDRFYVTAEGENMTPDELWVLIDKLKIDRLK